MRNVRKLMSDIEKRIKKKNLKNEYEQFYSPMDIPNGWIQLTRADSFENLLFAIEQLEKYNKTYSTCKHRDGRISVWVKKR